MDPYCRADFMGVSCTRERWGDPREVAFLVTIRDFIFRFKGGDQHQFFSRDEILRVYDYY